MNLTNNVSISIIFFYIYAGFYQMVFTLKPEILCFHIHNIEFVITNPQNLKNHNSTENNLSNIF